MPRLGGVAKEGVNVSEGRDQYFRTLNLPDRSGDSAKAALKRAYELRDFEIEHYWNRATYFWAFQVAIFAAFGLLWKEDTRTKPGTNPVIVVLAGLGILMALANALSARGSRFWQNNWEKHIDILEDEIEGRLYKTVWLSDGKVSFSVSRVNQHLSDYLVVFWVLIVLYVACIFVGSTHAEFFYGKHFGSLIYVVIIVGMIVLGAVFLFGQTTRLNGTLPDAHGEHDRDLIKRQPRWHKLCRWWHKLRCGWHKLRWSKQICGAGPQAFIRRYAPDEPKPSNRAR
jgi:hypothetical protein